jgi:AbrB family looped-hinge helix DNA binding protein
MPKGDILTSKNGGSMAAYATTKLSSKGQVVIPEDIREQLHLKEGDQFVVIGQGDTVILKAITPPSMDDFKELLKEARTSAKKAKLTPSDVEAAIKKVRKS